MSTVLNRLNYAIESQQNTVELLKVMRDTRDRLYFLEQESKLCEKFLRENLYWVEFHEFLEMEKSDG